MHWIELINVEKRFLNHTFNLCVEPKDFILVTGSNGSGKTTLIYLLVGFIRPDRGQIKQKKIKIGYCPERVILPRYIKVYEYLSTLAKVKKAPLDQQLLALFQIPLNQSIHYLSKGNMQKVALLIAFMGNPDLIILDEPFTGLDIDSQIKFADYLKVKQGQGKSIMISTHQPKFLEHLANKRIDL